MSIFTKKKYIVILYNKMNSLGFPISAFSVSASGLKNPSTNKITPFFNKNKTLNKRFLKIFKSQKFKPNDLRKIIKKTKFNISDFKKYSDIKEYTKTSRDFNNLGKIFYGNDNLGKMINDVDNFGSNNNVLYDTANKRFYNKKWFEARRDIGKRIITNNIVRTITKSEELSKVYRKELIKQIVLLNKKQNDKIVIDLKRIPLKQAIKLLKDTSYSNLKLVASSAVDSKKWITLSNKTISEVLKHYTTSKQVDGGSDNDFVVSVNKTQKIVIKAIKRGKKNKNGKDKVKNGGSFFKYLNNTKYDFSKYGIYKEVDSDNYNDNCLYNALKYGGLDDEKLQYIKTIMKNREIPVCKLNDICSKIKIQIKLRRIKGKNKDNYDNIETTRFGKEYENIINIGLLDEHYFLIDDTEITSFILKNIQYTDEEDSNKIYKVIEGKKGNKIFRKSEDRYIDSFNLVKILLQNKDTLLKKVEYGDDVLSTQFYDKSFDFDDLSIMEENTRYTNELQDPERCENRDKINKMKALNNKTKGKPFKVYFDFETFCDTNDNNTHKPYLCCYEDEDGNSDYFIGDDCALQLLRNLPKKQQIILIAHNCGYDYRFLIPYIYDLKPILKGTTLMGGSCNYFYDEMIEVKSHKKLLKLVEDNKDDKKKVDNILTEFYKLGHKLYKKGKTNDIKRLPLGNLIKMEKMDNIIKAIKTNNDMKGKNQKISIKQEITLKDSLKLIPKRLADFGKCFKLDVEKEVMPYEIYSEENLSNVYFSITEAKKYIHKDLHQQFENNIKKWDCDIDDTFNIIKYSRIYCEMDCNVLRKGYETFKGWMMDLCSINIDEIISIASLSHKYLIKKGCYDDVMELSGVPREFIQKCVVGGRTMCNSNKKWRRNDCEIADFDAVSLYPSAMKRIKGFLKGKPKIIPSMCLDYNFLKEQSGYFVKCMVMKVGKNRQFPLVSKVNEDGIRNFRNDLEGETIYMDKTGLEDFIKFQKAEVKIIQGFYFDEGHNNKVNEVIEYLFQFRKQKKSEGNPIQEAIKLLLNSGYGKSILKPIEDDIKVFSVGEEWDNYLSANYNYVKEYDEVCDKIFCKVIKPINEHFNNSQVGVEILSMSKRIMNEVICLGEDLEEEGFSDCKIYYQDTDSIHINYDGVKILGDRFNKIYNRELIGSDMGQFHIDFDMNGSKKGEKIVAKNSIFLGKKCYIDELHSINDKGEAIKDYHIRMKGIPSKAIHYTAELRNQSVLELYEDLFDGDKIRFDLLCGMDEATKLGRKATFKFNKDMTIKTLGYKLNENDEYESEFSRDIIFRYEDGDDSEESEE